MRGCRVGVAPQRRQVHGHVPESLRAIHHAERAGSPRLLADFVNGWRHAQDIRDVRHRHHAGLRVDEREDLSCAKDPIGARARQPHLYAARAQQHPRQEIGVMLQQGSDDIVTGLPGQGQGDHVEGCSGSGTEDEDTAAGQIEAARKGLARLFHHRGRLASGTVGRAAYRGSLRGVIVGLPFDDCLRRQSGRGAVQISARPAAYDGEKAPKSIRVKQVTVQISSSILRALNVQYSPPSRAPQRTSSPVNSCTLEPSRRSM